MGHRAMRACLAEDGAGRGGDGGFQALAGGFNSDALVALKASFIGLFFLIMNNIHIPSGFSCCLVRMKFRPPHLKLSLSTVLPRASDLLPFCMYSSPPMPSEDLFSP